MVEPGVTYHSAAVPDDLLVRELPEQMPGDRAAELEALGVRQFDDVVVQLGAGDSRVAVEVVAPGLPHPRQGVAHGELVRVVAEHEGAAEVGLPLLEDRAQVQERDVALGDHPVRRMLLERLQGVLTGPHDAPMPVRLDPEQFGGQVADLVGQLLLADARADQSAALDLVEQLRGLGLCIKKPFSAGVFVGHRIDATAGCQAVLREVGPPRLALLDEDEHHTPRVDEPRRADSRHIGDAVDQEADPLASSSARVASRSAQISPHATSRGR